MIIVPGIEIYIYKTPIYRFAFPVILLLFVNTWTTAQKNFINQGNTALESNDYSAARLLYEDAIDECGEDYKANHNLAILAAQSGDIEKGLDMLDDCIDDENKAIAYYNRALIHLSRKDYKQALSDLKFISNAKELQTGKLEREALAIKRKTNEKQALVLDKIGDQQLTEELYDEALKSYTDAMTLSKQDDYFLFKKVEVGLAQKNPFLSLENSEAIDYVRLDENQKIEVDLIKAMSLGRINRIPEAITLLENRLFFNKVEDVRFRKLLSYYYLRLRRHDEAIRVLKGRRFDDYNTYLIAGNAALRTKQYLLALKCFEEAKYLDPQNVNADIGRALSLTNLNRIETAIQVIDGLAQAHPENYQVINTKGIVYKDLGLYYKNRQYSNKAKAYLRNSAAAFLEAQKLSEHLKDDFQNNRALALFYLDGDVKSKNLWQSNSKTSSQNNLALYYASQKNYKTAYQKLDSLSKSYFAIHGKRNKLIDHNKDLARSRARLNDNYRFVSTYFLNQDKPDPVINNLFEFIQSSSTDSTSLDYILEYSDQDCNSNKPRTKRKKKKRRFKLFKRKKKKYTGGCPVF